MIEVREVLRAWLAGSGLRTVAAQAGVDRKTARRYVAAAEAAGLDRDCGVDQLTDELIGTVVAAVRPDRPQGYGSAWDALCANHDRISKWVEDGLTVVKIGDLLARQGVVVPQRTLHRYCAQRTEYRGRAGTVPVADGEPGVECQIDFARMGMVFDSATGRRRVVHALIFTAVFSRHMFVWLTFSQTLHAIIDGCEAAWRFFGRLDNSTEAEMRRLAQVRLLIIDDFALQPIDATATADFYELVVARHQKAATVVTSNRGPDNGCPS